MITTLPTATPKERPQHEPICNFCGTPESRARLLIKSLVAKDTLICDICVKESTAMLAADIASVPLPV